MSKYIEGEYDRVICRVNDPQYALFKRFGAPHITLGDAIAHLSAYCWERGTSHMDIVESVNFFNGQAALILNRQITLKVSRNQYEAIRDFADAVGWKISRAFVWMAVDGYTKMKEEGDDISHVIAAQTRIDTHITT